MFRQISLRNVPAVFFAFTMTLVVPQVRASDPTCSDNEEHSPYVCVEWSQGAAPQEGTDFEFDFLDPYKPDVTLIAEDQGWIVWSQDSSSNPTPSALGDLLLNPENNDDNFGVTVKNGENAGAHTVESIVLNYEVTEWVGHSNLIVKTTSTLAGDLVVVKDSGDNGGDAILDIGGDAEGDITVPGEAYGTIEGDFAGELMDIGVIPGYEELVIGGDLLGDLEVDLMELEAFLEVWGAVPAGVTVDIAMLWGSADVYFGMSGNADFEGDLVLGNGILSSSVVKIVGDLASGASVDFTGDNLRGLLRVDGDVSGDIRNIQNIHDIGRLWVLGSLAGTGRILIDGYCDGEIDINDGTVALSQIHIKEGLYDDGTIEINHSGPYFNANGTIYIGEPKGPLGNITFDGSILIQNDEGPSGCDGGELNGDIIVRGCHATNDYLDICPCGGGTGHVDIIQDDCAPQVQGYRCDDFNDCHCQD